MGWKAIRGGKAKRRVTASVVGVTIAAILAAWVWWRASQERVAEGDGSAAAPDRVETKSAGPDRSHTRDAADRERKRAAAMKMILALAENPELDFEDPESVRRWCAPLLEMEPPVMEAFIEAVSPYGGHAVMITAMMISALEWKAAVEELMLLVESQDVRRQEFASLVLSGLYRQWNVDVREAYGALDLPVVLAEQYRKHGPLSSSLRGAIHGLWYEGVTEGPEPLIDEKWFHAPELPEEFNDLSDPKRLEAALRSEHWAVRSGAMWEAFWEPRPEFFLAGLEDNDDRVLLSALTNLVESSGRPIEKALVAEPAYASVLRRSQSAADPRLRAVATQLYGHLLTGEPSPDAEPLVTALSDSHPTVRQFALDGLREAERFPDGEEGRVFDMLTTSPDLGVRLSAARWIEAGGSEAARRELEEWLERDELVSRYVAFVLEDTAGP